MTETSVEYDVIVVGLGPVGAVAAHLLASQGLRVCAIDPSLTPYDKPRAIGLDHESLRILQEIGIADPLEPGLGAYGASEYRSARGELLQRIVPQPEPFPLAWPPYNTFVQPEFEALLRDQFAKRQGLEVQLGWRMVQLAQDAESVTIVAEQVDGGARREIGARYLVGCDGAWSPVREALDLKFEDLAFDEPWLVVDVLVDDDANLPASIVQYCDPARPATFVRGPRNLCRWEIMLLDGEVPADMVCDEAVWTLLKPWLRPDQGRIWRAATYRFHALVATRWQAGRAFIAGDAAHQTPPFMAQGLNQGLRDVGNLCWKIAQVVKGTASAELLESYDAERRPNARAVIEMTKTFGQRICMRDADAAAERDRAMLAEVAAGRGELVRQNLLPPLLSGFLITEEKGGLQPGVGKMFPQPWVEVPGQPPRRMDDLLPRGWILLTTDALDPSTADLALAERLGVTLVTLHPQGDVPGVRSLVERDGIATHWMNAHTIRSTLLRPDHIVFAATGAKSAVRGLLELLQHHMA